jgi:hypothetical protein
MSIFSLVFSLQQITSYGHSALLLQQIAILYLTLFTSKTNARIRPHGVWLFGGGTLHEMSASVPYLVKTDTHSKSMPDQAGIEACS